jgi:hypothetical protein
MNKQRQTLEQKMQELRNTDPFAADANLDLRGLPSFLQAEVEELEAKPDLFEQADALETTMASKNSLKKFLSEIDDSVIADVARMPNATPHLKAELADIQANEQAQEFRRRVPDYPQYQENFEALVDWLCNECLKYCPDQDVEKNVTLLQQGGWWTASNLEIAYNRLFETGELPVYPEGTARALSAKTLTEMQRLCQMGRVLDGVALGLRMTFDLAFNANLDAVMLDPSKTPVVNEVVMFCWKSSQDDYDARHDAEFEQFASEFAGSRAFNLPLLSSAWIAFKEQRKSVLRDRAALELNREQEQSYTPESFDQLSDIELENLRLAVMREKSRGR